MGKLNRPTKNNVTNRKNVVNLIPTGNKTSTNGTARAPNEPELTELDKEVEWREKAVAETFLQIRKRQGRPTKLTEDLVSNMEVLARIGLSDKAMAEAVGIEPQTLIRWKKNNKDFYNRIKKAKNEGKAVLVNSVFGHGRKNWQAHAWLLERQYRSEFALDKQKVEVSGKDGKPITFTIRYIDKPEGV
jgi:hypothetical protein